MTTLVRAAKTFAMHQLCAALLLVAAAAAASKPTSLQIGVKKKAESCELQAANGDVVSIHFTVRLSATRNAPERVANMIIIIIYNSVFCHSARPAVRRGACLSESIRLAQGKLFDTNEVFDSSIPRGDPFTFTVGKSQVIKGLDRGLLKFEC